MADADEQTLWFALNRLIAQYWAEVDDNGGVRAHEFYLPDAVYAIGNNRFVGEAQIRSFYERRAFSKIMTRHVVSNLRVVGGDAGRGRLLGLMTLYRADGKSPFQGARPPAMIADFEARCALGGDRMWRFEAHELRPFIIGSDFPASITIRPQAP